MNRLASHRASAWIAAAGWLLLAPVTGCRETPTPEPVLRPVRTETVHSEGGARTRTFSGSARAGRSINLSFRVPGVVQRLEARVGRRVNAGEVIASLDPTDFDISVRRADAALAQARAATRNADANLERVRALWENHNASQNELDQALAAAESARALATGAGEALQAAQRQRSYTVLQAPVDGSIADAPIEIDENVRAGQTVVMLSSGTRAEVEIGIPEGLISEIREGDAVSVTFDAIPGHTATGSVTEVAVASTGAATTFPVTVQLDQENRDVRPGMAASVAFRFPGRERRLIYVPPQAVGEDRQGRFVFVLETTGEAGVGRVVRTAVEIGDLTPDGLEILDGLADGARVVTAGVRRLEDDQRVRLSESGS